MGIPEELEERITQWDGLSRWERSEIGRDLRRLGLSYGEIRKLIDVKKSTLATWCREIQLTDEQAKAIKERTGSRAGIPRDTNWRRRLEIEAIREAALQEAEDLIGDPYWVAGVVLYWAEGAKTRNRLELANTDPKRSESSSTGFGGISTIEHGLCSRCIYTKETRRRLPGTTGSSRQG